MKWEDKLKLLNYIIFNLEAFHSQGYIHRNLHSGNILQDDLRSAYISDLGLSKFNPKRKKDGVFGILPYIAPEVLMRQPYTKKSDIYSFGIIMWEILHGVPVSYYHKFSKQQLQLKICYNNLRPPVNNEAPQCYVSLMKECWDKEPEKRPTAEKLSEIFMKWKNDKGVLLELNNSKIMLGTIEGSYIDMLSGGSKLVPFTESILNIVGGLQN
ncbi:kinase-like domain-containing protein [Gigaspora rosea]|uniref:Kinase-like domain-containing protein n=1 Tax=Gigaspora rosea TaxID=44941 RepID=A0A397U5I7_9GLOM|nr:kinase-like domain-containing protein [Gigaspora rosea]